MHCFLSTCHLLLILIPFEEPPHLTADKAREVVNLAKELQNIKPVMESLGTCLAEMPGGKKPLDALEGLSGAFKSKQVPMRPLRDQNHS